MRNTYSGSSNRRHIAERRKRQHLSGVAVFVSAGAPAHRTSYPKPDKKTPPEGGVPGKQSLTKSDSSLLPEAGCEGRSEKNGKILHISQRTDPLRWTSHPQSEAPVRRSLSSLPSFHHKHLFKFHFVFRPSNPESIRLPLQGNKPDARPATKSATNCKSTQTIRYGSPERLLPVWKTVEKLHTRCGKIPHTAHSMP